MLAGACSRSSGAWPHAWSASRRRRQRSAAAARRRRRAALDRRGKPRDAIATLPAARSQRSARRRAARASPTTTPTITARAIEQLAPVVATAAGAIRSSGAKRCRCSGCRTTSPARLPRRCRCSRRRARGPPTTSSWRQVLGMAYIQTRQPDKAREALARSLRRRAGLRRRAPARGADDDPPRVRRGGRRGAEARRSRWIPRLPQAHFLLGQTALFRGRLDEAVALSREGARDQPGRRDGALPARRRLRAAAEVGRGDRRAAAVDLDQPVLQRPLHPARPRLHGEGPAGDRRGHAAARRRVRPQQQVRALPARPGRCSRLGATERGRKSEFEIARALSDAVRTRCPRHIARC